MSTSSEEKLAFRRETIADAIRTWNDAAISCLDIRHNLISPAEPILRYRLPAGAFLYTGSAKAEVLLDHTPYYAERFGLFHVGKGAELSVKPVEGWLEYYMVLYKAQPPFRKKDVRFSEASNPFCEQFGFSPGNPLYFAEHLRRMYERWKAGALLDVFYGKAALYHLVYEIYRELDQGYGSVLTPDTVAVARGYLDAHYGEAVSIQALREVLGISNSHFHRLFTARTGQSPQEYLIAARVSAAKKYLRETDCTLREIAARCGFSDELSLMRMFKKHVHMSTKVYRDIAAYSVGNQSIETGKTFPYNGDGQVSVDELKGKGATYMFKQMRSKAVIAAALSLMLLLSACSTAPGSTGGADAVPTSAVTSQAADSKEGAMRTISTERGDVEIPAKPKRVVALTFYGEVLALGVTPVGLPEHWAFAGSPIEALVADVPKVTGNEEIMAVEPDLIITDREDDYDDLSKIAPTVYFSAWTDRTAEERLKVLADLLGIDAQTEQQTIRNYTKKVEAAKEALSDAGIAGRSITILTGTPDGVGLVFSVYKGAHALYNELGMSRPEKIQELYEQGESWAEISMEVLQTYCGDYIMIVGEENAFTGNAVFESIPAVKAGHVFLASEALVNFSDVISVSSQIEFFVERLTGSGTSD